MPEKKKAPEKRSKIQFFGEIDLNKDGGITSAYPAWYFDRHIEELEENIGRKERQLERGLVKQDQVPLLREQIKGEKEKLESIRRSRPSLTSAEKDRLAKTYESLGKQIRDTMPTRKETKQGLVSPYDELKRLKDTKHIKISPEIASACGVKPHQGKISGDEANKCYQIIGKALGENTSVERLRRDSQQDAYKTTHDLTQKILERFIEGGNLEGA